jgi:conjugation system TraG family ATPase
MKNLFDAQPIFKIENDIIITKKADLAICFKLTLPESFTLTESELVEVNNVFAKAISILPEFTLIHKQDWYLKSKYINENNPNSFIERESALHFFERETFQHECYLYFIKTSKGKKSSFDTIFTSGKLVPQNFLKQDEVDNFISCVEKFTHFCKSSGFFEFTRMREADLVGTESQHGLIGQYFTLSKDSFSRDIDFTNNPFQVGDNHCAFFNVSTVDSAPNIVSTSKIDPRYSTDQTKIHTSFAYELGLGLKCEHIFNQYIFIDNQEEHLRDFEKKRKQLHSFSLYSRQNDVNAQHTEDYLQEAALGKKVVRAHFNVLIWDSNIEELRQKRLITSSSFEKLGCMSNQSTLDRGSMFWAGVPGNGGDLPYDETFFTFSNHACCLINFETISLSTSSDYGIKLCDRSTLNPILVDFTEEPMNKIIYNRNKYIIGGSGSGKSFFTNHLMRNYYDQGAHVLIVDVGLSYKKLCNYVGGVFFEYNEQTKLAFNPFYKPKGVTEDNIETLKTLVGTLWRKSGELSQEEDAIIRESIRSYYVFLAEHPEVFPCFNTFYEYIIHIEAAKYSADSRHKYFDVDSFQIVLSQFYKGGIYDFLLNSKDNYELLHERFIVFELDSIKGNKVLFSVVTFMIMDIYIDKLFHIKGAKRTILIEEAWKAIANNGMADFMKYLYKTVRKHNGEAIIVTQEVDDIVGNEIVKNSILNNADCKVILDLRKFINMFDQLQGLLGLTEKEKAMVLSVNRNNDPTRKYREVFIGLGGVNKVYAYEPSKFEYALYTTEKKENERIYAYKEKYRGDLHLAIRQFAEDMAAS